MAEECILYIFWGIFCANAFRWKKKLGYALVYFYIFDGILGKYKWEKLVWDFFIILIYVTCSGN